MPWTTSLPVDQIIDFRLAGLWENQQQCILLHALYRFQIYTGVKNIPLIMAQYRANVKCICNLAKTFILILLHGNFHKTQHFTTQYELYQGNNHKQEIYVHKSLTSPWVLDPGESIGWVSRFLTKSFLHKNEQNIKF